MAESVDTRIVEAKFDSSQFEEGVNKTVKKLEELKKSLNLKDTETSVTDLASKTSEATSKMSSSLEQLENRLTTFTGMLKNKLLSGIADEVVSAIYKIKNSFEGLVSTLSTGQISYGLNRYTEIMNSVRTLTFSGVDQSVAYETIERLGTYADQTSYSLDQLVSTMSKFKTAGADLDTAERMVIGASNAAASMGVNATEASRAYLNLQQAYSKGYMQQNDWQSFESLPMVGTKFNQAILDAAENIGTLEKQADGTYKTINKIDKTVKTSGADAKGITAENLGTKLSSKWFNKKVMEEVFGSTYYFNITGDDASEVIGNIKGYESAMKAVTNSVKTEQETLQQQLENGAITNDEYIEQLSEYMGTQTVEKLGDDLKETAPTSAEIKSVISDYLKENEDKLKDVSFDDLYTKQFESYLDTLEVQMFEEQNKELVDELQKYKEGTEEYTTALNNYNTALEEFRKNNNLTQFGWEAFRAGQEARSFTDVLNTLKDTISRGWATSFELIIGQLDKASEFFTWLTDNKLANAIYAIGDFRNAVLTVWAGGDDDPGSGRSMMISTLETLDELIGRILSHFTMFSDDEDAVESAANAVGQNLTRMTRDVRDFVNDLDKWFTDERIDRIVRFVTTTKNIISTAAAVVGAAAGFASDLLSTLWPVFEAVVDNIDKIITRVNEIFNANDVNAEDGLKSLKTGFDNVVKAVEPLVKPLTDFVNILGEIGLFFAEMFAGTVISNIQFFSDSLGFLLEVLGFESAQSEAENGISVLDKIKNSIIEMGTACKDAFNFVFDFFRSLYDDLRLVLGMREAEEGEEGGFFSNILKFFETSEFIKNVKAKFTEVWESINTFFFGEEVEVTGKRTTWTQRTQSEFSKMVENVITAINTFVTKTVPKYVKKIWDNITDFLFGKKIVAVKYSNGQYVTTYARFKSGFSEFLDKIFNGIKTFITKDLPKAVSDIWNKVVEAIFGKNEVEEAVNGSTSKKNDASDQVKGGFSKWLTQAIEDVKNWILSVPGKIKSLWNTIIDVIFYRDANPDEVNPETGESYAPNTRVKNAFTTWLESIPEQILNWIKDLPKKAAEIWNKVLNFIFGKEVKPGTVDPKTGEEYPPNTRIKEGFSAWLATAVETVKSWIKTAGGLISNLWDIVLDAIFGSDTSTKETEIHNAPKVTISQDAKEGAVQTIGASLSQEFKENTSTRKNILDSARSFIESLGIDIGKILTNLPAYIVQGWNSGLNIFSDLVTRITNWLKKINLADATEKDIAEEFKDPNENSLIAAITEFGKSISDVVTTIIPNLLSEGWKAISGHSKTLWASIKSMFGIQNYSWSDLSKDAAAFGTKVADEIKTLPDKIRTAIAAIKNEFSGESFDIEVWKSLYAENPQYAEEYQKSFADKQKNGLWEAIKSIFGSIGDVIVDFGPDILEGINKVLEWLGEKITMVTEIFADKKENESIGDAVKRHMGLEGEENKEPSGIVAALTKIGQTIYDLIVNIIPGFIEAGINVLAQEIPKLINKIGTMFNGDAAVEAATEFIEDFTGEQAEQSETVAKSAKAAEKGMQYVEASVLDFMNQSNTFDLDEAKDGEKNTKNIKDIALNTADNIGGIIGAFTDLATSDTGKTIAMVLAISLLISKLRDLASSVNFSDTFEAAAKAAKWEAIKTIIMFVTGLLTYVTILAATGNEDQLAKVEEIFSKFESFVDKLINFISTMAGVLGATSLFKTMRTFADAKSGITTAVTGISGGFGAAIGTAASKFAVGTAAVSFGGSVITESIQSWIGDVSASFALIKTGLDSLLQAIEDLPKIKEQLEESGDAVEGIGKFLIELSHVFDEKTLVTTGEGDVQEKYTSFRDKIEDIMRAFTELSGTMAVFKNSVSGKYIKAGELVKSLDDLMGMQSKMTEFAAFSTTDDFNQFKYAIASLGSALSMYSGSGFTNADLKDENITSAIDAIIKILQNEKMITFASELESSGNALPDAKDVYTQSEKMVMLAGAIGSIGEAAKNINKNTGSYIQTLFETLASIDFGLTDDESGDKITKFAQNFGIIGNAIGTFANEAKGFTQENVDVTKDAIDLTIKLMSALAQYSQGSLDKAFNGDASIEQFGINFKTFADQLAAALQVLGGENVTYNQAALEQSLYAFRSIVISYSELNRYFAGKLIATSLHLDDIFESTEEASEFANRLATFSGIISKADINAEDFKKVYVILDVLSALTDHMVLSNGVNFAKEMKDLAAGLNPINDSDNIFVALTEVINKVKELTTTYTIDESFIDYFEGFGDLFNGIASLATALGGGANYVTTKERQAAISGTIEGILQLFASLNTNFPMFEEMVHKVNNFDNAEIEKSKNFFAALKDLAVSLNYFKDEAIFNGFDNLQYFDWSSFLETLHESMFAGVEEDEFYAPKITPVLEITDDFLAKANQIRSLLGYGQMGFENGELTIVSNNNTSLDLANQLEMPTVIDYTNQLADILWEVRDAADNIRAFDNALRNTRFVINGDRLTDVIGPSMDEWLGREGFYVARRNAT